jgi:cytochrome c oxidase subunit II
MNRRAESDGGASRWRRWIGLALLGLVLTGCHAGHSQSVLHPASEEAKDIARLWWVMASVLGVAFVIVMGLAWRAVVARREPGSGPPGGQGRFVIWGGIIMPGIILFGMLIYSLGVTLKQRRPLEGTPIQIIGHQWWWEIRYPESGGITANELILPAGEPVLLELWAADVVHSFWVPNLHGKIDLMPEVRNRFWLRADEPGTWRGQCAEFCGRQHAWMALTVVALPRDEFDAWLAVRQQPRPPPLEEEAGLISRGEEVFFGAACHTCHAIRDTPAEARIGPDLTHLGSRPTLGAGLMPNTPENLARWILDPQGLKPGNRMPATPLPPEDVSALVAYLHSFR